jgi:hypothetical protein
MREFAALARLAWRALVWALVWLVTAPGRARRPIMRADESTTSDAPRLIANAPGVAAIAEGSRIVEGLIVPFGPDGQTSMGRFTFGPGSIELPAHASRVKLLREHDQRDVIGVGQRFDEVDAAEADRRLAALGREPMGLGGIWGRYAVPEGTTPALTAHYDAALAEVRDGVRDAFSVGVALTPESVQAARRAGTRATPGRGRLRETSTVSVPAFDDARAAAASTDPSTLVVAAWHDGSATGERHTMHRCPNCQAELTPGVAHECANATASGTGTTTPAAPATASTTPAASTGSVVPDGAAGGAPAPAATTGPTPVAAAGGSTTITAEAPVYTFDGNGASFVRDSFRAREDGDADAAARLGRFAAELRAGQGPTADHKLAAVETRATAPEVLNPERFDSTRFMSVIDRGRPLWARLAGSSGVRLTDATPFRLPVEGEFDGVGVHTEGTAHVAEGTLTLYDAVVTPSAISGAYRVSRELVDASNPAIDRVALNAMTRDYRNATEDLIVAAIDATGVETADINTLAELRARMIGFAGTLGEPADLVAMSTTAFSAFATEVDGDGRPMLPYVGPSNASGTIRAGYTGASIDGVEVATAHRLAAGDGVIVEAGGVMVGESNLLTFRFDQPEGPGIIKLALWAYAFAAVIRAASVDRFRIGV